MNTPHTTAIRQAAEEIALRYELVAGGHELADEQIAEIISRHLAPLLEQAEKERTELRDALEKCATHVGGHVAQSCTHRFHVLIEEEVRLVVEKLKARAAAAEGERDQARLARDEWPAREAVYQQRISEQGVEIDRLRTRDEQWNEKWKATADERMDALAKLAACEALLRECVDSLPPDGIPVRESDGTISRTNFRARIAHLSKQEPAPLTPTERTSDG